MTTRKLMKPIVKPTIPVKQLKKAVKETPKLEHETITYFQVDYRVIEKYIEKVYGLPFNLNEDQHGCDRKFTVKVTGEVTKFDRDAIKRWKGKPSGNLVFNSLMNDMANKKLIPVGVYLIICSQD